MTEAEATTLLDRLRGAYPRHPFEAATARVYADALEPLDHETMAAAVDDIIRSGSFFPPVAELLEAYSNRRKLTMPRPVDDDPEPPTAEERERVRALMADLNARLGAPAVVDEEHATDGLAEVGAGACSDCREQARRRWTFGRVTVCHGCLVLRRRAAGRAA